VSKEGEEGNDLGEDYYNNSMSKNRIARGRRMMLERGRKRTI